MTLLLSESQQFLRTRKIIQPSEGTLQRIIVSQREKARKLIFEK